MLHCHRARDVGPVLHTNQVQACSWMAIAVPGLFSTNLVEPALAQCCYRHTNIMCCLPNCALCLPCRPGKWGHGSGSGADRAAVAWLHSSGFSPVRGVVVGFRGSLGKALMAPSLAVTVKKHTVVLSGPSGTSLMASSFSLSSSAAARCSRVACCSSHNDRLLRYKTWSVHGP